jgi:putative ABC transport system ATP-binding protein
MVIIDGLHKAFGERVLFEDFNMEIAEGEFVVFSGPSGCGKTTLLNMIGSLELPDAGEIVVDGIDLGKRGAQRRYFRDVVGFLFQNFALIDNKTVCENMRIVLRGNRSDQDIEEILAQVGLADKMHASVFTLSGGEQQRVALARLMLKECRLILADEPTGSLDRENADLVMDIIKSLHREGKTIILESHSERVIQQGERVVRL